MGAYATIATIFLPRSYCHTYSGYSRVGFCLSTERRIEHMTPSLSWSQRCFGIGNIPPTTWPTNSLDITQLTVYSICSLLQDKVYPSRIANVEELKTRLIDESEHFHQSIVDDANDQWWRCRCIYKNTSLAPEKYLDTLLRCQRSLGNIYIHVSGAGEVFLHTFPVPEKCLYTLIWCRRNIYAPFC